MVVSLPTQTKRLFNTTLKLSFDPPAIADCPLEIEYQMHRILADTQFCWWPHSVFTVLSSLKMESGRCQHTNTHTLTHSLTHAHMHVHACAHTHARTHAQEAFFLRANEREKHSAILKSAQLWDLRGTAQSCSRNLSDVLCCYCRHCGYNTLTVSVQHAAAVLKPFCVKWYTLMLIMAAVYSMLN